MSPLNKDYEFSIEEINKINKEVLTSFDRYKKSLEYMASDIAIEALCLPKPIENVLLRNNIKRIYDLIDLDLTKIKGLGRIRRGQLAASLNQFLAMC